VLDDQKRARTNKWGGFRVRRGANRGEVRPRTAEQGFRRSVEQGPRLRGCVRGAECRRTATKSNPGAPPGSDPPTWGPSSAVRCAPRAGMRPGPDPVPVAPVREGALKAAIDVCETGRNASAPANGPSANGPQPHPVAGCLRTGTNAGLRTPTRSHPQKGPLFRAPVRTPRDDS
jgi:hypothetical protein